jgi:MerR family redox-sensitive transcriptional activator SoxR
MAIPSALTPREAAERAGMSVSALHYYEREGLIASWRTSGNQRRYDRITLRRLGIIRAAQGLGIPLAEIKERLAFLPLDRPAKKADWSRLAEDWRADLQARIGRMERLRDYLDGCIGCGCLSMDKCPLYNAEDRLAARGPGAAAVERAD